MLLLLSSFFAGDCVAAGDSDALGATGEATGDAETAGDATGAGVGVGVGVAAGAGMLPCITDLGPVSPGKVSNNATNIKAIAAPIVILDKIVCVPRGPNAALFTVLVKSAPASALPGCKRTATTRITQAKINKLYKIIVSKATTL